MSEVSAMVHLMRSCSRATAALASGEPCSAIPWWQLPILDRLLHHSHVITIRGVNYRLKEKRRSGLLQKGRHG
jgi:hypothetical protein